MGKRGVYRIYVLYMYTYIGAEAEDARART